MGRKRRLLAIARACGTSGSWQGLAHPVPTVVVAGDPASGKGFSLQGFTIRGFEVHGVHLACVVGFSLTGNVADGNLVYGLFPSSRTTG